MLQIGGNELFMISVGFGGTNAAVAVLKEQMSNYLSQRDADYRLLLYLGQGAV
jgi:hypothetical protein